MGNLLDSLNRIECDYSNITTILTTKLRISIRTRVNEYDAIDDIWNIIRQSLKCINAVDKVRGSVVYKEGNRITGFYYATIKFSVWVSGMVKQDFREFLNCLVCLSRNFYLKEKDLDESEFIFIENTQLKGTYGTIYETITTEKIDETFYLIAKSHQSFCLK